MSRVKNRSTVLRWVTLAAIVSAIALVVTFGVRAQGHSSVDKAALVTLTPSTHMVEGHPVTMWIGSMGVDRAVIQLTRSPGESNAGDRGPWEFITRAMLESSRGTVDSVATKSRLADGTMALTLEFDGKPGIEGSVLVLETAGNRYSFRVQWLNRSGS